ncbi:MAG: hypothetical protein IJ035_00350 [Oscillospiraceae bacterium]|nr:hypothetical protein [Oscillospiraceae bacterium]
MDVLSVIFIAVGVCSIFWFVKYLIVARYYAKHTELDRSANHDVDTLVFTNKYLKAIIPISGILFLAAGIIISSLR